jgi:hypothetical protein
MQRHYDKALGRNQEFLDTLHQMELDDWGRHGRVREKWEKYLRGPETKRKETQGKRVK